MTKNSTKNMKAQMKNAMVVICIALSFVVVGFVPTFGAQNKHINIEVSKGTLIRFDKAVDNVFIADPNIADIQVKSPTLAYVFGKKQGQTTVYAISNNDEVVYEGDVSVNHNLGHFEAAIHTVMPDTVVNVESYEGLLILTGHVKNPEQAEEARKMAAEFIGDESTIINKLEIATPIQVNLRVRIAEIGRETMKQLGFNWENILSTSGGAQIGMVQGRNVFDIVPNQFTTPVTPMKNYLTEVTGLGGGFPVGNLDFNFIVDALEEEGVISVLAEPNLTAYRAKKPASLPVVSILSLFFRGKDFPFNIRSSV